MVAALLPVALALFILTGPAWAERGSELGAPEEVRKASKGSVKGAQRVKAEHLRKFEGVLCAVWRRNPNRADWVSVRVIRRAKGAARVISYDALYSKLSRKLTKLRGGGKSPAVWKQINRLAKQKKKANGLRIQGMKKCRRLPGMDLRANLAGALGVALGGKPSSSPFVDSTGDTLYALKRARSTKNAGSRAASTVTVGEALDASYLASSSSRVGNPFGEVKVEAAVAGKDGVVFVRFSELQYFLGMEPSRDPEEATGCSLAVLYEQRKKVICIERRGQQRGGSVGPFSGGYSVVGDSYGSMQVDENGRLYYTSPEFSCTDSLPNRCEVTTKLKYFDPGTGERRDIIGQVGAGVSIFDFEILEDGSLIVTGRTDSFEGGMGTAWVRWFSSDGERARRLIDGDSGWLTRFADGNIYFRSSVTDDQGRLLDSIRRVTDDAQVSSNPDAALDPRPWIGAVASGEEPRHGNSEICVDPLAQWGIDQAWDPNYCANPAAGIDRFWSMSDGRVFAQAWRSWSNLSSEVTKVFDPRPGASEVQGVWTRATYPRARLAGTHGDSLVLLASPTSVASFPSPSIGVVGDDKVLLQNPDGASQRVVSEGLGAIDIYTLERLSPSEMAVSGQRPGSGNFVFGVVDLESGTARVDREIDVWLRDLVVLD